MKSGEIRKWSAGDGTGNQRNLEMWQRRRRWANAGIGYALFIGLTLIFLSPLVFAALSSLKTDPLEYPPKLLSPQLNPVNWVQSARLGRQGAGNPFFGGFKPGRTIEFDITYFTPLGQDPQKPEVTVPKRRPGAGLGSVFQETYAADYAAVSPIERIDEIRAGRDVRGEQVEGLLTTYVFRVSYAGSGPKIDRVPLDATVPVGQIYTGSTITASRIERRGRVASFDNISPGALGYIFRNYQRVFKEAKSITTGTSLFANWFGNSFFFAFVRVITNLLLATMAGYALARFNFKGRGAVFMLILVAQMVPVQVIFISNYLVLRDGIWGISRLFGAPTLLNNIWGLIIGGAGTMIEAAKVFLMKQYFEGLPRQIEEAARIDGAGEWTTYWKVVFPMARPALGALVILSFQGAWNEFFWSFIILTSPDEIKTLPIGLLSFRQIYGAAGDWGLILAGAMLSALPVVILFIVFQKYFLEGVSFGGTKG
ncbi:carbohydrate ABC transporter permease [Salinispira pacifica]|uniref:ABC transporter sugar permease n=1 Tax=Salinispira pacifica TaxID=1307761 RepID=V5WL38_9SPIO|nr:carbohydrate ABC transporter permease [Salinispira pacifica]AHC16517.1 ABC transporter sugar permease [Salinispira pacifica]